MKLTRKQINIIRDNTPNWLKGKQASNINEKYGEILGFFQPTNANWCYTAQYITVNSIKYLVVTRFGEIM